jgi:hypothetical protein
VRPDTTSADAGEPGGGGRGRLDARGWEARDGGGGRQAVQIVAGTVQFLGSRVGIANSWLKPPHPWTTIVNGGCRSTAM